MRRCSDRRPQRMRHRAAPTRVLREIRSGAKAGWHHEAPCRPFASMRDSIPPQTEASILRPEPSRMTPNHSPHPRRTVTPEDCARPWQAASRRAGVSSHVRRSGSWRTACSGFVGTLKSFRPTETRTTIAGRRAIAAGFQPTMGTALPVDQGLDLIHRVAMGNRQALVVQCLSYTGSEPDFVGGLGLDSPISNRNSLLHHALPRSFRARRIFSGVNGISSMRTPTASKIALAMAGMGGVEHISPTPLPP